MAKISPVNTLANGPLHWHQFKWNITRGKRGNVRGKWDVTTSIWYQQPLCRPDVTQTLFSSFGAIKYHGMSTEPGFTPAALLLLSAVEVGVFHIVQHQCDRLGSVPKNSHCRGKGQFPLVCERWGGRITHDRTMTFRVWLILTNTDILGCNHWVLIFFQFQHFYDIKCKLSHLETALRP